MDADRAESAGEKIRESAIGGVNWRKKKHRADRKLMSCFFLFIGEFLCRRLALMHQGRVCVDISPIYVRV